MDQPQKPKRRRRRWAAVWRFLKTVPGLLTALATTLTAVAGILAALTQLDVIQVRNPIVVGPTTTVAPTTTTIAQALTGSVTGDGDGATSTTGALSANNGLATVYLRDLTPTESANYAGTSDDANVNGQAYRHSLLFYTCCGQATADYNLGRHYQRLEATIGVNDEAPSDAESTFEVFLDGRKVYAKTVTFGKPVTMSLNVAEVLRLHMVMTSGGGSFRAVWGDARLLGVVGEVPEADVTGTTGP